MLACAAASEAQTYYYYPSSGTNAPGFAAAQTTTPTYYYRRGLFGRMRSTYPTQYYQAAVAPQTYQPAVTQEAQVAQPVATQVVPVSYVRPATDAAPAEATTATANAATTEAAPASVESSDPYGFLSWLNSTRAAYGLPAVGHDPNLSSWAAENNNHQAARGMGHFVMGPARRQNAAFGSFASIGTMWMNSPAHRAALLDPTIRWMGLAGLGAYWTFNAY
jgi:uncharacterized protein YkwD